MNETIDVRMELSKNEIVDSINNICEKHGLPLCLLNIILANILNEVNGMTQQELQKNMTAYLESQKEEKKKNKKEKESEK